MIVLKDNFERVHDYLRISITDKCNLKCFYCNPVAADNSKLKKEEILSYSEILRLIRLFVKDLGFKKIRITGGEPFARKGVMEFFEQLFELKKEYPFTLGITTNGTLLYNKIDHLVKYGVDNLNISLDSLQRDKFIKINGIDNYNEVIASIDKASVAGFKNVKINTVVIRDINDNELTDFTAFAIKNKLNIRFIEYMPFTDNSWSMDTFISYSEMKQRIEKVYTLIPISSIDNNITKDFTIPDTDCRISFITSVSDHFCGTCNRLRITSEGKMKLCLFSAKDTTFDLRALLRKHSDDDTLIKEVGNKLLLKQYMHPEAGQLTDLPDNYMKGIGG